MSFVRGGDIPLNRRMQRVPPPRVDRQKPIPEITPPPRRDKEEPARRLRTLAPAVYHPPPTLMIYINKDNGDVFETLNEPFRNTLPGGGGGRYRDSESNRMKAALACICILGRQLRAAQNSVYELTRRVESLEE